MSWHQKSPTERRLEYEAMDARESAERAEAHARRARREAEEQATAYRSELADAEDRIDRLRDELLDAEHDRTMMSDFIAENGLIDQYRAFAEKREAERQARINESIEEESD